MLLGGLLELVSGVFVHFAISGHRLIFRMILV